MVANYVDIESFLKTSKSLQLTNFYGQVVRDPFTVIHQTLVFYFSIVFQSEKKNLEDVS